LRIAYLVAEFPILSQTFVVDEIREHHRNGIDVMVISVKRPTAAASMVWDIPIHYVVRSFGLAARVERYWLALMGLLTEPKLWKGLFGAKFGGRWDRVAILAIGYRFKQIAGLSDVDVLHCHFGNVARPAAALRAIGLIGMPVVTTFHGFDLSATLKVKGPRHYDILFRFGSLFLPISEMWARKLRELGCDPAHISVHHVGIDCSLNAFEERGLRPGGEVRLVSIGRLVEKKGHIHTIRAVAQLYKNRPDIRLKLDLVGEGELLEVLANEVAQLGLQTIVSFHGGLPHAQALAILKGADLFILASVTASNGDMEGIPVSLIEAMARGIPVISTYHSGIPELVEDGVNGFLVAEGDDEALANALERAIDNAARWPEIGRAGRLTVEKEFNRSTLGRRLIDHYRDLGVVSAGASRRAAMTTAPAPSRSTFLM